MSHKVILLVSLMLFVASVFGWGQIYLKFDPQYHISIGNKSMDAAEVKIGSRDCIVVVRGDAIAIDCD